MRKLIANIILSSASSHLFNTGAYTFLKPKSKLILPKINLPETRIVKYENVLPFYPLK